MEDLLNQFVLFARENPNLAYFFLFISAIVENLFPPVPGDTVTLIGAYFVGRGHLSFAGVLISTTLGSVVGFMALFALAYKLEKTFFETGKIKWIQKSQLDRVESLFQRYGYGLIAANRFLSGVRSVISISAGIAKLNFLLVTLLATLSAILWNGVIIYAGAFIGESWEEIQHYINIYNKIIISLLVLAGVIALITYWLKRNKKSSTGVKGE
ncbi:MAG: DedA family protein [Calditrichaeota bacterium]|nr:MAG: DedA family protein [Calditrichota bacterium]